MSPSRPFPRSCWAAGLPAALALGLLLGAWSSPSTFPIHAPAGPIPDAVNAPDLRLTVDPTSWWMVAGNSTRFEAAWAGVPPGCSNAPLSFRWSVVAGWGEGTLSSVEAPIANFTASSVSTGTAEVEVRSATVVTCSAEEDATVESATANVTVVVPPSLGPLAFDTDPVSAGSWTNLTGSLLGGDPPYRIQVAWGDGGFSEFNLSTSGPFSFPHRFPDGAFAPTVTVEDAAGLTANRSVVEPEYSGSNFTVGIEAPRYLAEVGAPVAFTGRMIDPPSLYSEVTVCSDALDSAPLSPGFASPGTGSATNFTCAFATPGTAEVSYEVVPSGDGLPPATATLTLPVEPSLGLSVFLSDAPAEVGLPATVSLAVSGGVPPFTVRWGLTGSPNGSSTTLVTDGTLLVPIDASAAGSFGVTVVVEDAVGLEVGNSSARLSVEGGLSATAAASVSAGPTGPRASVSGSVTEGCAPFLWFVVPDVPAANGTPTEGNLSLVAGFAWTGVLPREGNTSITVGVVDGAGAVWCVSLPVMLVAPLEGVGRLTAVLGNSTSLLVLNLTLQGGLPPFAVWANSTVRADGNGSAASDGSYSWSWPVNATGAVLEQVVVVDRLGVRWSENATVNFPGTAPGGPPSPSPSPTSPTPPSTAPGGDGPTAEVAGASTLALILAAGVALYWRRRRAARAPAPPAPDPVTVLRRIIAPADGVDRASVELLAEEAGVPLPTIRATLARLVEEGRLRSETGSDGEEVYAWSPHDTS